MNREDKKTFMSEEDKKFVLAAGHYTDRVYRYLHIPVAGLPSWLVLRLYLDLNGKIN